MYNSAQKQFLQTNNKFPTSNINPLFSNEQQLSFLKYIERKNYFIPSSNYKNNPLMPLYSIKKSDIILPKSGLTKPENDICSKLYFSVRNKVDNRPVNCIKFFSDSKKILYGTSNGFLTVVDVFNPFDLRVYHKLESKPAIRALQFNKDESFLLTGDKNGNVTYFKNNLGENFVKKIVFNYIMILLLILAFL